ncbi:MAG: hypothetical protein GY867_05985 [bacterium]|nr:hypothetical protein [bacterium]
MIERIASAGAEQSAAAEEIARSVDNISAVSSAASNGAQESAAASEELNRNAENLREMVSMFRIVGGNLGILQLAKEDHTRYMSRLKKVIDGEIRATWWGHTDHTGCRFGKWYYGPGRNELGHLSDFGRIENVHIKVHQFANEAVEVLAAGDTAKARSLFGQAVSASHEVKDLIDSLRESANSEGGDPAVEDQGATPAV